jgi:hypothetical protein
MTSQFAFSLSYFSSSFVVLQTLGYFREKDPRHLNFGPQDILEKKFYKIKHRSIATTRAGSFFKTLHGTLYLEFNNVT